VSGGTQPSGRGWRLPPVAESARIAWPDDFGTRFTILVDTEEEFDWNAPLSRDGYQTRAMAALPEGHARFALRGVSLAYMIDYPIATDPASIDVLRAVLAHGYAEIGTQLHAWVNPPLEEALTPANSYAGNLAEALEGAKLDALTNAITAAFGTRPIAYRAGRYGIGPNTLKLLVERGYRLDSSMRAGYEYTADGGPDFTAIGNHAFRAGADNAIVELPLTTVFTGLARSGGAPLHRALGHIPRGRGIFARAGLLSRVALTPEDMPLTEALEAIRVALGEGLRLLNFSFHSPSLAHGHTPYVRDAGDLAKFLGWWDAVLDLLDRRGARPASIAEVVGAAT
jgi:hypothetical protein